MRNAWLSWCTMRRRCVVVSWTPRLWPPTSWASSGRGSTSTPRSLVLVAWVRALAHTLRFDLERSGPPPPSYRATRVVVIRLPRLNPPRLRPGTGVVCQSIGRSRARSSRSGLVVRRPEKPRSGLSLRARRVAFPAVCGNLRTWRESEGPVSRVGCAHLQDVLRAAQTAGGVAPKGQAPRRADTLATWAVVSPSVEQSRRSP